MNNFTSCFENHDYILMEGALGERLKREYQLDFDEHVVMGNLIYSQEGRHALKCLWNEYAQIAYDHGLPFTAKCVRKCSVDKQKYDGEVDKFITKRLYYNLYMETKTMTETVRNPRKSQRAG